MIKKGKNKFISLGLMLAVSATAVGASALAACGSTHSGSGEDIEKVTGTTYYVSTTGSLGADGTESDPWDITILNDVSAVHSKLKPGDTVLVEPGTYELDARIRIGYSGNYKNPITIKNADPTQKATLSFYAMAFNGNNRGVQIDGNYFIWDSIDICGAGDNGMYIGGSYNTVLNCEFYDNRDTGLQLGRSYAPDLTDPETFKYANIDSWPSYNLIKNCTSYNNYDNETYGENADGFAAKLTVGYHNVFDGCIAYRNSDDGWDLYGKGETGIIGSVVLYNCVAFENGYIMETQAEFNAKFTYVDKEDGQTYSSFNSEKSEDNVYSYVTRDGDGNGFKLGGSTLEGDATVVNCLSFNNRMHGVTDNSNPGTLSLKGITSVNNSAGIDSRSHTTIAALPHTYENGTQDTDEALAAYEKYFHTVGSNGYIYRGVNKLLVIDESGAVYADSSYATIDENGYILDKNGEYKLSEATDDKPAMKLHALKADLENCVENGEFGYISPLFDTSTDADDQHGNIDVRRAANSYNNLADILSINTEGKHSSDKFKGSAEYSILAKVGTSLTQTNSVRIEGSIDADSSVSAKAGATEDLLSATDIFEEIAPANFGISTQIHAQYRNADGSINMGNIFKIKDYSLLFGDDHKIGSDLTKTSWEEYEHPNYTDLTTLKTVEKSVLQAVSDILYIPANTDNVYQDFHVLTSILDTSIAWSSSDSSILEVTDTLLPEDSMSGLQYVKVIVYRPEDADQTVTLTATINYRGKTLKKNFEVNVAKAAHELGEISVEGVVDGYIIKNLYDDYEKADVTVLDASDYNGKILSPEFYEVSSLVEYATSKNGPYTETPFFDMTAAGVYRINETVTLKSNGSTRSYSYLVFVVAPDGDVDFVGEPTVSVNEAGYTIQGELSNVSGTLYAMVSETEPSVEDLKANGESYTFRSDSINVRFEQANDHAYDVYYVICNPNGRATSQIYKTSVEVVEISTTDAFFNLAQTGGESNKIYRLTQDLDFTGYAWSSAVAAQQSLIAYLDGCGHTISNITCSASTEGMAAVFYKINGGTVVNINFENINLSGYSKVGIFGQAANGYFENIKLRNIGIFASFQRAAALIGQVDYQNSTPLVIKRVSLINDDNVKIETKQRVAGIIGFSQIGSSSSPAAGDFVDIRISDCYVDAIIDGSDTGQAGGIYGTFDSENNGYFDYSLTITNCYFAGTAKGDTRCGGILAYHKGLAPITITNCINTGDIYHAGSTTPIVIAEKNASGILGGYNTNAVENVENCYANLSEHNAYLDVQIYTEDLLGTSYFWSDYMKFDTTNTWELIRDEGGNLVAPYIRLR